ncbi:MAG: hypothetical protein E6R02_02310 [Gammaproteobacteria bacterium]|nr:MAG: hypothetical protein E6R02_02310 [Gammaproteobacteria bacterium]
MNESDDAKIYDHQLVLADAPYLPLTFLLTQLAYFIFPEVDHRGNEIPFSNNMHDVNGENRKVYLSHLRSTLVEAINREEIVVKNHVEIIIKPPATVAELKDAIIYKSQIHIFTRLLRIKTIFKPIDEMVFSVNCDGKDFIQFKHFNKYLSQDTESASSNSSPMSADAGDAVHINKNRSHDEARTEEDSNNDKSRLATYIELANAFKIKNDDEKNRQWFRERCSNPNRYKEFLAARTVAGRRQPGAAALFDVLSIVAILLGCKKQKERKHSDFYRPLDYRRYLRNQIEHHFPNLLRDFDTYFGTSD